MNKYIIYYLLIGILVSGCSRLQEKSVEENKNIKTVMIGSAKLKVIDEEVGIFPTFERMHYPMESVPTETVQLASPKNAVKIDSGTERLIITPEDLGLTGQGSLVLDFEIN